MFSERGIRRFEKANTETVMSKEFLTVRDASNKLRLPGSTNTYTFITKREAITAGADPDLLTGYGYNDFPVDDDIVRKVDNMEVLNNFLSARAVYCRIGIVADPDDERIPFVYAASDFKNITFGVVVNGTMVTTSISLSGSTGYWYNIATSALSGNYLFCCSGSSSNANTQYRVYKLNTSNNTLTAIATYTGRNFKFPRSFSFVEKIGDYHYAYFDVSRTYRHVARLYVNETNDSSSYANGADASPTMYSQVLTRESNGNYATFAISETHNVYIRISSNWDYHSSQTSSLSLSYTPMTEFFVRCLTYGSNKCINVSQSATLKYPCLCEIYSGTIVKNFGNVGIQPELINYKGDIWWTELNSSGNTYKKLT